MWQRLTEPPSIKQTYCICSCTDYTACRPRSNDRWEKCHSFNQSAPVICNLSMRLCLLCYNTFQSHQPTYKHIASVHVHTTPPVALDPTMRENCHEFKLVCSSHMESVHETLVSSCLLCGNTFRSLRRSSKHISSVHAHTTPPVALYPTIPVNIANI